MTTQSALTTLAALVPRVDWQGPQGKPHRANMRSIAIHARNHLDRKSKPRADDLALAAVLDAFIDWSTDPTSETKTGKLRQAIDVYADGL